MTATKLRTCFISAPAKVDTTPLRQELEARGIRWFDVATSLPVGSSVLDTVRSGIAEADFLCGVIPDGPVNPNVLFELGLAVGRDRPALVFVDPRVDVPSDLGGIAVARATLKDTEALRFHLDMFLGHAQPRANGRNHTVIRSMRSTSPAARAWLDAAWDELRSASEPPDEIEIVRFLKELFERFGAVASGAPSTSASFRRADLAVWIDDLESIVGNPLLVELVGRPERVAETEDRFRRLLAESRAILGLLVYWGDRVLLDGSSSNAMPLVIRYSVEELVEQVRAGSFVPSLLERRNKAFHAVPVP